MSRYYTFRGSPPPGSDHASLFDLSTGKDIFIPFCWVYFATLCLKPLEKLETRERFGESTGRVELFSVDKVFTRKPQRSNAKDRPHRYPHIQDFETVTNVLRHTHILTHKYKGARNKKDFYLR